MMEWLEPWWVRGLTGLLLAGAGLVLVAKLVVGQRRRRSQRRSFARALIASQENERKRIAAELHDGLGQNLLLIKNRAILALEGPSDKVDVSFELREISKVASQSISEIREISRNLRPYHLDWLGLTKALQAAVRTAAQASPIDFTQEIAPVDGLFSAEGEINLYRIVQEGLNNVLKHSQAERAKVVLRRERDGCRLIMEDDGRGVDAETIMKRDGAGSGWGLPGMQERARILGGQLQVHSRAGQGFRLELRIPMVGHTNGTDNQGVDRG